MLAALSAGLAAYLAVGVLSGSLPAFRRSRNVRFSSAWSLWLVQAGVGVAPGMFVATSAGAAAVMMALIAAMTGSVRIAAVPAAATAFLPAWFFGRRRSVRLGEVQSAWPDGLRHVIASVRSGLTLPHAIEDMISGGPPALASAFERFPSLAATFGFGPALETIRDGIADPTTDRVVEVLLVAHESGGALALQILEDLAEATSEDLRALEEIRTNALEHQLNARIVFVVPWLVLVLLTTVDGSFREFYRDQSAGLVVILIGALLSITGTLLLRRLAREDIEPRVFGTEDSS